MNFQEKQVKVALITGAARRIGASVAQRLHDEGYCIALHYHQSHEAAQSILNLLNQKRPHSAALYPADLKDRHAILQMIDKVYSEWGRLDILINNASNFYRTPFGSVTEAQWQDLIDTNLKAPYFLCQAAKKYLIEAEGVIINITDIKAEKPLKEYSVYCIAKSGLAMLTRALAKELAPKVRVNSIAPGVVAWPEEGEALNEEKKEILLKKILLQRVGSPKDIAEAVKYLACDATYITGQVLTIDGGRSV